ncbi:zinc-ribbon domain-containing protein [Caballeronia sp. CLC5]
MLGGHHGFQNRGGHDRGHGGSHGQSHGGSHDDRYGHHGNGHGNSGGYADERTCAPNEGWGRTPGRAASPAQPGVTCPKCSAANAEGARFCSQCATSLTPQACAKCNQPMAAGTKFCSQCGTSVAT